MHIENLDPKQRHKEEKQVNDHWHKSPGLIDRHSPMTLLIQADIRSTEYKTNSPKGSREIAHSRSVR